MAAAAGNDAIMASTPPTATKPFFIASSLTVLSFEFGAAAKCKAHPLLQV
jgi:hypothetical protein